jgi:hypothetical protein
MTQSKNHIVTVGLKKTVEDFLKVSGVNLAKGGRFEELGSFKSNFRATLLLFETQ